MDAATSEETRRQGTREASTTPNRELAGDAENSDKPSSLSCVPDPSHRRFAPLTSVDEGASSSSSSTCTTDESSCLEESLAEQQASRKRKSTPDAGVESPHAKRPSKPSEAASLIFAYSLLGAFEQALPDINHPIRWQELGLYDSVHQCNEQVLSKLYLTLQKEVIENHMEKRFYKCAYTGCRHRLCIIIEQQKGRCRLFETAPPSKHNHPVESWGGSRDDIQHHHPTSSQSSTQVSPRKVLSPGKGGGHGAQTQAIPPFRLKEHFPRLKELARGLGLAYVQLSNSCMFMPMEDVHESDGGRGSGNSMSPPASSSTAANSSAAPTTSLSGSWLRLADYGTDHIRVFRYHAREWVEPKSSGDDHWPNNVKWQRFESRLIRELKDIYSFQ